MNSKTKLFGGIAAVAIVALVSIFYLRPQQTKRRDHRDDQVMRAESTPSPTNTQIPPRADAASAVRSQSIPRKVQTAKSLADPVHHGRDLPNADRGPQPQVFVKKAPEQLIAKFIDDDPTQVFTPEAVRYHAAVDAEQVDPMWGPQTQTALQDYLQAQFGNEGELVSADCRTDLCELHVVLASNNDQKFNSVMQTMKHQLWWDQLQLDQDIASMTFEDGQLVVVYFFARK